MDTTEIPVPGTPAYWAAQREAVALLKAYNFGHPDLLAELGALRQIAAHGFAASMMAAQGDDLQGLIRELQRMADKIEEDDVAEDDEAGSVAGLPPEGTPCANGCPSLHATECSICGYEGPGVRIGDLDTVAEYCRHCNARTYQSPDGICELCGRDAEDAGDTPTAADPAPCARPDPDRHAQPPAAETRDTPNGPGPATCECCTASGER